MMGLHKYRVAYSIDKENVAITVVATKSPNLLESMEQITEHMKALILVEHGVGITLAGISVLAMDETDLN